MTNNISTKIAVIKTEADPGAVRILSGEEFADQLEALAQDIEHEVGALSDGIEQLKRNSVFRIAAFLAKAHGLYIYHRDERGFRGWAKNRLGYSRSQAYRLLNVDKLVKASQGWDTLGTLPASGVYALAAPSTPDEVRTEITARIQAGEKVSLATITDAIARLKAADSTEKTETPNADTNVIAFQYWNEGHDGHADEYADEHVDHDGDDQPADHAGKVNGAEASAIDDGSITTSIDPSTKSAKRSLLKVWNSGTPEDRDLIRDLVREEYFVQASASDLFDQIPADRRAEVLAEFLDRLTVEGMLAAMTPAFGQTLRARVAAPKRENPDTN